MTLRLNGSTSGYTEIDAPAVAGSNTLVLPTGNGTSQQVLATNGSGALSWVGGRVMQVVQGTLSSTVTTSSTTAISTGLSVSITPSSASNKILLYSSATVGHNSTNLQNFAFARNTTLINSGGGIGATYAIFGAVSSANLWGLPWSMCYLDSPASTNAITYSVYYWTDNNTVSFNGRQLGSTAGLATIIAVEVMP